MKKNKKLTALICCVLMLVGAAGATLAWLTDKTETVTNTFTTSDINIELDESTEDYQMIPGYTIDKDPLVTVKAGSEDCWVFLKVKEGPDKETFEKYLTYMIDSNNWTVLEKSDNVAVYYAKVTDVAKDRIIKVLAEGTYIDKATNATIAWGPNQVAVKPSVTKEMMEAINDGTTENPTLTFKAFAVQLYSTNETEFSPEDAWAAIPAGEKDM